MPSTVNNLETIAVVPTALEMGGDAFSKLSDLHHLKDGGARLFGVSGHVNTPGVFEACVGLTLRELIYDLGGGVKGGELLAVIPGGSSCPILRADDLVSAPNEKSPLHPWNGKSVLDVPLGVDTFRALGTMLGTCCAIVLSTQACPVLAMHNLMRFYRHESCGQCTPCREGSAWIFRIMDRIVAGQATIEELDRLSEIADNIMGNTICAFGEGTAMPALGFLKVPPRVRAVHPDQGQIVERTADAARALRRGCGMKTVEFIFFAVATFFVLGGGIFTVVARNPIRSAMGLLTSLVGVAGCTSCSRPSSSPRSRSSSTWARWSSSSSS